MSSRTSATFLAAAVASAGELNLRSSFTSVDSTSGIAARWSTCASMPPAAVRLQAREQSERMTVTRPASAACSAETSTAPSGASPQTHTCVTLCATMCCSTRETSFRE
eukprot:scaffold207893_cov24-Tisochrysis_lutea.AAC.4